MAEDSTVSQSTLSAKGRRYTLAYFLFLLLGLLSVFAQMLGVHFLPSLSWVEKASVYGWVFSLASAVFGLTLWLGSPDHQKLSAFGRVAMVLAAPLLFGILGRETVLTGIPFAWTVVAGVEGHLDYFVDDADDFGDRRCRNPVRLTDMPVMFDKVCDVPMWQRSALGPGMRIRVLGRGTWMGIIQSSVAPVYTQ